MRYLVNYIRIFLILLGLVLLAANCRLHRFGADNFVNPEYEMPTQLDFETEMNFFLKMQSYASSHSIDPIQVTEYTKSNVQFKIMLKDLTNNLPIPLEANKVQVEKDIKDYALSILKDINHNIDYLGTVAPSDKALFPNFPEWKDGFIIFGTKLYQIPTKPDIEATIDSEINSFPSYDVSGNPVFIKNKFSWTVSYSSYTFNLINLTINFSRNPPTDTTALPKPTDVSNLEAALKTAIENTPPLPGKDRFGNDFGGIVKIDATSILSL